MDDKGSGCATLSEDWFTVCKQRFKGLSPAEKSSVILTLIDMCDTTARFNLLKSCNQALHCDILALMPQIALENILDRLSVPDVLNACKVSHQWNKCISQSQYVWKKKWLEMGIGSSRDQKEFKKRDWKEDCVTAQGLHAKIEERKAVDYNLDLQNETYGYIQAMDYCDGKLVLCHSTKEGGSMFSQKGSEWNYLCSFPASHYGYSSSVCLLSSNLLVIGGHSGKVTLWRFANPKPGTASHAVNLLHACHGHTSIVLSVDGCEELGVAVSGSRDARVKVWSLHSGDCVKSFEYSSPVLQVTFFCGENSLMKGYDFMLVHSSENIFLQSWIPHAKWQASYFHEQCIVTDANILPGIHIKNGNLYYCSVPMAGSYEHTGFNCKQLNLPGIVGDSNEPMCCDDKVFSFQGIFRKLLKVGSAFSLLIADDSLMAIDTRTGSILFKEYVPYSAATSLTLPQITVGMDKWLDGLLYVKRFGMILGLAIYGRSIALMSWGPAIPEFPSKED